MSADSSPQAAAVPGLTRSDPHGPGITRERISGGFRYRDPSGAEVSSPETLHRIGALGIPPAWKDVWISPDPLGHIQATGVDRRGRTQYRYHQVWREQRDVQKFAHMLRFAAALPALRSATVADLGGRRLDRDRVTAAAVRLIDLGLFRIGGEKYAELDHHYGATTLQKRDVTVTRDGVAFDYIAKEGKRRTITVTDDAIRAVVRALISSDSPSPALFSFRDGDAWRPLRSHEVSGYIATRAGGHFTAKEYRTWNATVLMALLLASADQAPTARSRKSVVTAAVREVADRLGDTPAVARGSYIDPRVIDRYTSDGQLAGIPQLPALLPATAEAEIAVAALLAGDALPVDRGHELRTALGPGHVRPQLGEVLTDDERGLAGLDPPALVQAADVERVEAELVVEPGHELLGCRVVAGQCERPALRVTLGMAVAGHVSGVDHAEGAHDLAGRKMGLQQSGRRGGAAVDLGNMAQALGKVVDRGDDHLSRQWLDGYLVDGGERDRDDREVARGGCLSGRGRRGPRPEFGNQVGQRIRSLGVAEHDAIAMGDRCLGQVAADVSAADDRDGGHVAPLPVPTEHPTQHITFHGRFIHRSSSLRSLS